MIGIQDIAGYIPADREWNFAKKERFGIDDDFIMNKIGVHALSRRSDDEETSDMCLKAYETLCAKTNLRAADADCVVVCTQNPDGAGLPHTSAILHNKIGGRQDCAVFDISLGCSGYVHSLSIVKSFMAANGMRTGLLFTADPYSKIIDSNDKNTSLLFGDAATVTLLSTAPALVPDYFAFSIRSSDYMALQRDGNYLTMNGRAVFNFTATIVPQQVKEVLRMANARLEDIDLFLLHQASKYVIDVIQQRLGVDVNRLPNVLSSQGNTISSSIPLLLEKYLTDRHCRKIIISGFGVGLAAASALLKRP